MAVYAIGDIQGCFTDFVQLLRRLNFSPSRDQLWLTGDLVNRGPRSLEVLRYVRELGSAAITVLGNHDLHLLAVDAGATTAKKKDTLGEILAAPDRRALLDWLRHQPLLHQDARLGYTMVHAGLAPQWSPQLALACAAELETALRGPSSAQLFAKLYGDEPNQWSEELGRMDRLRFITNCLTRMRFCDEQGRIDLKYKGSIEAAPRGLVPWFRALHRKNASLRIVCGHWSALGFHDANGVLCIDTGCVWGASLCAVRLDSDDHTPILMPCSSSGLSPDE